MTTNFQPTVMTQSKHSKGANERVLKGLFIIHGLITFAASIVLVIAPTIIPKTVNIDISGNEYLLCYFLGAAELAIAFLSFFGTTIEDKKALRIISSTFIVFHSATGILETYALIWGISSKIILNIIFRIVIAVLFWYYGIYKSKT
jgi:hypothetical protein